MTINNDYLTDGEKKTLSFFANMIGKQEKIIIDQINHATIKSETDPYSMFIRFTVNKKQCKELKGFRFDSTIQVLHEDGDCTCMIMFIRDGFITEFEVFHKYYYLELNYDKICFGKMIKEI